MELPLNDSLDEANFSYPVNVSSNLIQNNLLLLLVYMIGFIKILQMHIKI